jgi:hypothetical protein
LAGRTEENHENLTQEIQSPGQDSNTGPLKHKAGMHSTVTFSKLLGNKKYVRWFTRKNCKQYSCPTTHHGDARGGGEV